MSGLKPRYQSLQLRDRRKLNLRWFVVMDRIVCNDLAFTAPPNVAFVQVQDDGNANHTYLTWGTDRTRSKE